jgi:hypothetical protein
VALCVSCEREDCRVAMHSPTFGATEPIDVSRDVRWRRWTTRAGRIEERRNGFDP